LFGTIYIQVTFTQWGFPEEILSYLISFNAIFSFEDYNHLVKVYYSKKFIKIFEQSKTSLFLVYLIFFSIYFAVFVSLGITIILECSAKYHKLWLLSS